MTDDPLAHAWKALFGLAFAVTVTALVLAEQWSDAAAALAAFGATAVLIEPRRGRGPSPDS